MNELENIVNLTMNKSEFTYKELKKQCIVRGLPFKEVVAGDFPRLSHWLIRNTLTKQDESLLNKFDDWVEEELKRTGKDYLIHPQLRLSFVGNKDTEPEINQDEVKKPKIKKIERIKKEKDSSGLYKGTKKSYTFELQSIGKTVEQTIIKVTRKFPDAKEKSIKIWYNRAKKLNAKK